MSEILHTITLPPFIQEIIPLFGERIYSSRRKEGVEREKFGSLSEIDTHNNGYGAEYALSLLLNCSFDFTLNSGGRRRGYDMLAVFIESNGTAKEYKVECKWTSREEGSLFIPCHKVECADIFVLTTGNFPTFNIVGWCRQEQVLAGEKIFFRKNPEKPSYEVTQDKLERFPDEMFLNLKKRGML